MVPRPLDPSIITIIKTDLLPNWLVDEPRRHLSEALVELHDAVERIGVVPNGRVRDRGGVNARASPSQLRVARGRVDGGNAVVHRGLATEEPEVTRREPSLADLRLDVRPTAQSESRRAARGAPSCRKSLSRLPR